VAAQPLPGAQPLQSTTPLRTVRAGRGGGALGGWTDDEPQSCEVCGADALRPATRRERLARWFAYGRGGGSAWYCAGCGASWSGGSGYAVLSQRVGWQRGLRLPLDVVEALRGARSWHPVPRFYAIVGVAALAPAAAVAAATRVRWWVALVAVPSASMVGAFLWSLASGLGPRGRRDVLMRVAPQRGWQREVEEEVAGLRRSVGSFTLLAPDGWSGELTVGGASWSRPRRGPMELREVAVVADQGDPALDPARHTPGWVPAGPRVEVRVTREPFGFPAEVAVTELVDRAFPPPSGVLEDLEHLSRQERDQRLLADARTHDREREHRAEALGSRWREGTVVVDGTPVPARLLTHAAAGVATFDLDEEAALVVAVGVEVDGLVLRRVSDPAPLVDALEVRHRRLFLGEAPTCVGCPPEPGADASQVVP
jgi:hypothetical protein